MAVQGAGLGKGPDDGAFKDQTSFNARDGASKKVQTDFPVKDGMKDMTKFSRVGPGMAAGGEPNPAYHFGPDASSVNPSDPQSPGERGKALRKQPSEMRTPWGNMVDANGRSVDPNIGGKVLGEAILSGSNKLPDSVKAASGSPARQPG